MQSPRAADGNAAPGLFLRPGGKVRNFGQRPELCCRHRNSFMLTAEEKRSPTPCDAYTVRLELRRPAELVVPAWPALSVQVLALSPAVTAAAEAQLAAKTSVAPNTAAMSLDRIIMVCCS